MTTISSNQLETASQVKLAEAVREVAKALSGQEKQWADARIQWAAKLQEAGNLVLASTVLAQVFSAHFNPDVAFSGLGLFIVTYLFAYWMMKGGGRK